MSRALAAGMPTARLILAGGGGAGDSRPLDEILARWLNRERPMLYLPIAMDPNRRPYESCHAWVRSVFEPLGVRQIAMWTDLAGKADADLGAFGAIYIGGGNTFTLLHAIRTAGLDGALRRFVERGGAVYGGSAGAILLGEDIMTAAHADPNHVGLEDTAGLGLARGYSVWCHYEPADDERITAYVRQYGHPVVALRERAGVVVEGDTITAAGFEPVVVFTATSRLTVPPASPVPPAPTGSTPA